MSGPHCRNLMLCVAGLLSAGLLTPGCGGESAVSDAPEGTLGEDEVRQQCNADGREVRAVDVNNDGEPDIPRPKSQ